MTVSASKQQKSAMENETPHNVNQQKDCVNTVLIMLQSGKTAKENVFQRKTFVMENALTLIDVN